MIKKGFLSEYSAYLLVGTAAALWGTIGIYVQYLHKTGLSSLEIVAFRVVIATVILFGYLAVVKRDKLRVRLRDIHLFIGTGILSICFFNWSYFTAIGETSLSVAVVLLYTGPAFVVLMSRIIFSEPVTLFKFAALMLTLIGVILVSELFPMPDQLSLYGIIVGVGAGFGYALYSIFGKFALKRYDPLTVIFYTFLTASVFLIPITGIVSGEVLSRILNPTDILVLIGLGIFPTVIAYLCYTAGLNNMEAGKASLVAMTEPVTAAAIGVFWFGEALSLIQLAGIVLVLSAVIFIYKDRRKIPVR
jgi:drug/metabolite transporter, DME family